MTVLDRSKPARSPILIAPEAAATGVSTLMLGAGMILLGRSVWLWGLLLIVGGMVGGAATLRHTLRRLRTHASVVHQQHAELAQEYSALQTDYFTLEKAFDDLQAAYGQLERSFDVRTVERDQKTLQLQHLLDESRLHAGQLTALNEVAAALNATLDRNEVLACILRQLERLVTFDSASVLMLVNNDDLEVIAVRGMAPEQYEQVCISLASNALARQVIHSAAPVVLDDVRTEASFLLSAAPIRSWIGSALRVGERVLGILTVDSHQMAAYSTDDARLVASFATQAALALHNAHLYEEAERRAAETELLLEMTRTVSSSLHLPEVMLRAAAAIGEALNADDVAIMLLDTDKHMLIPQAGATGKDSYLHQRWSTPTPLNQEPSLAKVIQQGCARVIHAVSASIPYSTLLALPLRIKDQVLGVVLVATPNGDTLWGPQQLVLAEGLAISAAIAIEHARLYEQARRAAQIEERSRLARELHDSVTQTLFSMTLTAEAARAQIERNPDRVAGQLDRLKAAAHQSLGEMRELLLQLRPTPLQEYGLIKALQDHIATLNANDVQIRIEVHGDDRNVKQHAAGLYRIAQEAIANALRHAHANQIQVRLDLQASFAELVVQDDGVGFDPLTLQRGGRQLGLTSMAERAAEIGGTFALDSLPGNGTSLVVRIPTA